jgi:uncharacterized membrane protein YedE/YeeE
MTLLLAIVLGTFFGFTLHRAGATHSDNILRMLSLQDLYLAKAILFAIGLTSVALWVAVPIGLVDPGHFSVKATHLGVLAGGLIFGVGFALAGYCPGTAVAALGQGRRDAIWFVAGGLLGALAYMVVYPAIEASGIFAVWDAGKITLAATGNEHFASVAGAWLLAAAGAALMAGAALLPSRH